MKQKRKFYKIYFNPVKLETNANTKVPIEGMSLFIKKRFLRTFMQKKLFSRLIITSGLGL